jgi:uncharacterized repeat protein (TIGR03809 family)
LTSPKLAAGPLEEVAHKWRRLAERRRAYFVELYHTGRWKRYFAEEQFLASLRDAIRASERWADLAPSLPLEAARQDDRSPATDKRTAA